MISPTPEVALKTPSPTLTFLDKKSFSLSPSPVAISPIGISPTIIVPFNAKPLTKENSLKIPSRNDSRHTTPLNTNKDMNRNTKKKTFKLTDLDSPPSHKSPQVLLDFLKFLRILENTFVASQS